ncbi:MAG: acyl-CoA dehydrogenase family protein [archaeon]
MDYVPYKFNLSDEERIVLKTLDDFKRRENLAERTLEWNAQEHYPVELYKSAAELGFFGQLFSEEYGGTPVSERLCALTNSNFCEDIPELFMSWSASVALFGLQLREAGTEDQKKKYLPPIILGDKLGAFCLTEASGGSNSAFYGDTVLADAGDYFLLNGQKTFITNGTHADYFYVFCRDASCKKGDRAGIRSVVVEREYGVESTKLKDKMGMRCSDTATIYFEDVKVPKDCLVFGREGFSEIDAFNVTLENLVRERAGCMYMSLGIARGVVKRIMPYLTSERVIMRKSGPVYPISFPLVKDKVRDMLSAVRQKQRVVFSIADDIDSGNQQNVLDDVIREKIETVEMAIDVAKNAIQLAGGYGFMEESHLPRLHSAAMLLSIGGGTVEIQKSILDKMYGFPK